MPEPAINNQGVNLGNMLACDLVFFDLETSGLDHEVHEIIEIAAIRVDHITLERKAFFEVKVKPKHIETADPESLLINGYKKEDWKEAVDLEVALNNFIEICNGTIMVAQNITFDWAFMEKALHDLKKTLNSDYHRLDLMSVAYGKLRPKHNIQRFSLRELREFLNIDLPLEHKAMKDVELSLEIFKRLMQIH